MVKTKTKDFIPFGDEWIKEMGNWNKKLLIELLRKVLIENKQLKTNNFSDINESEF